MIAQVCYFIYLTVRKQPQRLALEFFRINTHNALSKGERVCLKKQSLGILASQRLEKE